MLSPPGGHHVTCDGVVLVSVNQVDRRRARLVATWVTVFTNGSVAIGPTQPGRACVTDNAVCVVIGRSVSD